MHGRHGPALGHVEDASLFHFKDSLRANSKAGGTLLPCGAAEVLAQNNLEISSTFPPGELDEFCRTALSVPVVTCSTMGSFLAQEVIKGVSLSGKPGFNVWVFNCKDYQVRAMPIAN